MGGLLHDFFLVDRQEFDYWDYSHFHNNEHAARVHDDLIRYMGDSLEWITCHVPMTPPNLKEVKGLNYYGPTIIKEGGAAEACNVFRIWADLFSRAPDTLELTGGWGWINGEPAKKARYLTISADRDSLVVSLKQIAKYAEQANSSHGRLYVLHLGI